MCLKVVGRGLVGHWTIWVIGPYGTLVSVSAMRVTRASYRLAGEGSPKVCASTVLNNILDSRSSVPSGRELLSNEKSRLGPSGGVCGGKAAVAVFRGRRLSTFCGLFGTKLAPLYLLRILSIFIAFTRARINISIHFGREMRCLLSREVASVSFA